MTEYLPLKLVKEATWSLDEIKNLLATYRINADKLTLQEYIDSFAFDHRYGNSEIREFLTKQFVLSMSKVDPTYFDKIDKAESTIFTEAKDVLLWPAIYELWGKSKQVFKPDKDFAEALSHTEKACISASIIDHLPYNLFYIDLTNCDYNPIEGVFVYIKRYNNDVSVNMNALTQKACFSYYINIGLDDKLYSEINIKATDRKGEYNFISSDFIKDEDNVEDYIKNTDFNISRKDLTNLVLQMILYLSIENPQLTESDLTKHTYRIPSETHKVKHKWSEVRIQDVGIKYGNQFRKTYSSYKRDYERTPVDHKRKSPIPHFRCAHWHKFWVGKGRTELKLIWMEPVFVGNGDSHNVIIHTVK